MASYNKFKHNATVEYSEKYFKFKKHFAIYFKH